MARTGRRPGASSTRAAILEAARRRFADAGYNAASLRTIAADAGVDPGVVVNFFGSKDGLFQAAVGWPFDPAGVAEEFAGLGPEQIAFGVARTFLEYWENPATRASLLAVLRSAMTHDASATLLREFLVHQLLSRVIGLLDGPEAELGVNLAVSQLIGVAILRYILRVEPIATVSTDTIVAWLTPTLAHSFAGRQPAAN